MDARIFETATAPNSKTIQKLQQLRTVGLHDQGINFTALWSRGRNRTQLLFLHIATPATSK